MMYNAVSSHILASNPAFNRLFLTNAGHVFETPSFCTLAKLTATVTYICLGSPTYGVHGFSLDPTGPQLVFILPLAPKYDS
ncbi:hypothetical protein PILCRDRAFT_811442 [Piloderma croceum F 1598]|uniref:Uncharacterized protein n=1 Tax=Piloderma croceum (strain F 1598) TaxID=765440 RepID=A0A0C3GJW8_PILCF|nr:hypothetical protein PILCRDRAFT_811442 [Piloderma croceum F 1598]